MRPEKLTIKNTTLLLLLIAAGASSLNSLAQSQSPYPSTFREAKQLMKVIYASHQQTFYCGCDCGYIGKKGVINTNSCGYSARKPKDRRYKRLEWEHVMPASWLGNQRQCWKNGGRKNCRKTDIAFNKMEANMVNLVPSIGEVNRDRSNYRYGQVHKQKIHYGRCDFNVDHKARVAQPKQDVHGDIARTMFFMRDKYGIRLSSSQTRLYEAWNKEDPISTWERSRDKKILKAQGHSNHYITEQ